MLFLLFMMSLSKISILIYNVSHLNLRISAFLTSGGTDIEIYLSAGSLDLV